MATNTQKKILILAASSDIGKELTHSLLDEHHKLFLVSRNVEALAPESADTKTLKIDFYNFEQIQSAFEQAVAFFGQAPDAVICLSGSLILKPAHLCSEQEFDDCINANLKAAFATVRSAAKVMKTGGSIVLMSSVAANLGLANHELIAAAKAGIEGLTRSAAASYAKINLRINAVAPALTETKLSKRITSNEHALKASTLMHPLGRIGTPKNIVRAINFLLDTDNDWMTGQTLAVDGGMSRLR